jgi:hypothetical protein
MGAWERTLGYGRSEKWEREEVTDWNMRDQRDGSVRR